VRAPLTRTDLWEANEKFGREIHSEGALQDAELIQLYVDSEELVAELDDQLEKVNEFEEPDDQGRRPLFDLAESELASETQRFHRLRELRIERGV